MLIKRFVIPGRYDRVLFLNMDEVYGALIHDAAEDDPLCILYLKDGGRIPISWAVHAEEITQFFAQQMQEDGRVGIPVDEAVWAAYQRLSPGEQQAMQVLLDGLLTRYYQEKGLLLGARAC